MTDDAVRTTGHEREIPVGMRCEIDGEARTEELEAALPMKV